MTETESNFIQGISGLSWFRTLEFRKFFDWFKAEFGREPYSHNENDIRLYKAFHMGYISK